MRLESLFLGYPTQDTRRKRHYSNTLLQVGLFLFPLISISFGLSSPTVDLNETEKSDHEMLVNLEQSMQKMTLELEAK